MTHKPIMFENGVLTTSDKDVQKVMDNLLKAWDSPQKQSLDKVSEDLFKKKEELIKTKLTEKGFEHLIEGLRTRRFPKVCCVKQGEWELYFADDNADEGAFIIGFKNVEVYPQAIGGKFLVSAMLQYQDTLPLINKQ